MSYSKYHAHKVTIDGHTFDSKHEGRRYQELKLLEQAGRIQDLQLQVAYELIPALYESSGEVYLAGAKKGKPKPPKLVERACVYVADFVYTENGKTVVEDAKGMKTPEYRIKRKLMYERYNIKIKET